MLFHFLARRFLEGFKLDYIFRVEVHLTVFHWVDGDVHGLKDFRLRTLCSLGCIDKSSIQLIPFISGLQALFELLHLQAHLLLLKRVVLKEGLCALHLFLHLLHLLLHLYIPSNLFLRLLDLQLKRRDLLLAILQVLLQELYLLLFVLKVIVQLIHFLLHRVEFIIFPEHFLQGIDFILQFIVFRE